MEVLEQTLRELESRERNQHNLETTYVKDLLPGFKEEFKSLNIQDLENYGTYSLQNILDDLRHIQMLLDGSPTIQKFKDKKEFLLELSRKMLRKVQRVSNSQPEVASENEIKSHEPPKEQKEVKKDDIQLPIIRKTKPVVKPVARTETKIATRVFDFSQAANEQQPKQEEEPPQKTEATEIKTEPKSLINIKPLPKTKVKEDIVEKEVKEIKEEKKVENIFIEEMEPVEIKEEKTVIEDKDKSELKIEKDKEPKENKEAKDAKTKPTKEVRVKKPHKSSHKGSEKEGKRKKGHEEDGQEKLSQIAEEVDGSDNDTADTQSTTGERVKKKWQLTEDQEKQIQEMSAQYGVEVEALKSYLETKAGQHHFNWLGIKRLETKVDMNLEIAKLESEYERFVQRKRHFGSVQIPVTSKLSNSKTLPILYRNSNTSTHASQQAKNNGTDQFTRVDSAGLSNLDHSRIAGTSTWSEIPDKTERVSSNKGNRNKYNLDLKDTIAAAKKRNLMHHSQSLPNSREKNRDHELTDDLQNLANALESKNNFHEEHWSNVSFAKSKGHVKLPSITSFNPYSKKAIPSQTTINAMSLDLDDDYHSKRSENTPLNRFHHLTNAELYNVLVSPNFKALGSQKRFSGLANGRQMPVVPIVADYFSFNKVDTKASLEDSLAMEIANKDRRGSQTPSHGLNGLKLTRKFSSQDKHTMSHINTSRSKYVNSSNNIGNFTRTDAESMTLDDFTHLKTLKSIESNITKDIESKRGKGELIRMDSDLGSISRAESNANRGSEAHSSSGGGSEESIGIGTTMQTISTKSVSTVYTQEAQSRFMSMKSFNSGMRVVEGDLEYYGNVKRIKMLGGGSQAKVYLCRMKEYESEVALKQYEVMKSGYEGMQVYDVLKEEFHMLRQLEHENVIKYHCLYRSKRKANSNYLEFGVIMEYMAGGSLEDFITKDFANISSQHKKSIMKQILEGLNHLHQNNIIHRDLKPENILLNEDKTIAKITDFGISTQTNNDANIQRSLVGTPWYMAPEIINEEAYSLKADIWSAGCCFLHMFIGQKPFFMANAIQAMLLMTNYKNPLEGCDEETIKKIESHRGLKDLLELCFMKDKDARPTAEKLLQDPFFTEE